MVFVPQYYMYYDNKTGQIYQVSHVKPDSSEYAIEISLDDANDFLSLKKSFNDYQITYSKTGLNFIRREEESLGFFFRNYLHEWISEDITNPKCQIVWNFSQKSWTFSLSRECKDFLNSGLIVAHLNFFITLKTDFDFLVRSIVIEVEEILKDKETILTVPFISKFEHDISKISVSTSTIFDSYGLKLVYE